MAREIRCYPTCCTSAYCGKTTDACATCECKPELDAFNEWRERTGAVKSDPIWCPTVYVSTK